MTTPRPLPPRLRPGRLAPVLGFLAGALLLAAGADVSYYEEAAPSTLNPLFARTMVDRRSQELVFDRLFYRSAITNELRSGLVESWERIGDGRSIKLKLKEGVKWHDGKPFGPDDVCFTIEAMLDPATPSEVAKGYREALVGCTAQRDNTVQIEFTKVYHNPRERVAFSVLPKHAFNGTAINPDLEFSSRPIGTGPMKASRGKHELKFSAMKNPHHDPKIAGLIQTEGGDPLLQVRSLLNGGVQGVISVSPTYRGDVSASDEVALKSYDLRSWWFVALNTGSPFLRDKRVRQALDLTIDRMRLRELTIGVDPNDPNPPCEFVSGPFVQSSPYYNRAVKTAERANPEKAEALMREAGANKQAGRWVMGGQSITLRIGIDSSLQTEARDLLNQIGNQLQEGGFDRRVDNVTPDEWVHQAVTGRLKGQYDALIGKWSFGVVEDVNDMFHTRQGTQGSLNIFDYSDPQVDAILARYDAAKTDTEAQDAYHDLHAYLAKELPYLFLWKLDTKSAWRNEIRSNTISPYYYFTEFDGWRL
ncbi:MAG: ABC transporter substrate-binding protein [Myxococcota bacterium]